MFTFQTRSNRRYETCLVVDDDSCLACGACVPLCPQDALALRGLRLTINHDDCTRCERCAALCPVHALALVPQPEPLHETGL